MKNVVVCCDGTANEFARDRTNVVKLFYALSNQADRQVACYHPGLGTMEPPGTLTSIGRGMTKLLGSAFGYGLASDIRDTYLFIMHHFEPGDRLFLFGFSRGAYTVRALASLLKMYGVLPEGNDSLVPYAIRLLTGINKRSAARSSDAFRLAAEFKKTFSSITCRPHFVGVWDTVSSVGWIENPLRLPFTADNPDIRHCRHAIALDERRAFFRTNLWHPRPSSSEDSPRDIKQVWFAGVHCDVGGGYRESESGLSKLALEWMLMEAQSLGLELDQQRTRRILGRDGGGYAPPDPNATMHKSLTWKWWPAEIVPKKHYLGGRIRRRLNLGAPRPIPDGALIHWSAYKRDVGNMRDFPLTAIKECPRLTCDRQTDFS